MKKKLDELLVSRGFIPSLDEAQRYIMAGKVLIDDEVISKPGTLCSITSCVRIKEKKTNYVSRSGDKLAQFLKTIDLKIKDKCAMDIGISTGGFTDVLLQNNINHVLGIDVGYGILDYKLRRNQQLSLLERTNAREVTITEINGAIKKHHLNINDFSLVVMDVSFISVFKILPNLTSFLNENTEYVILIKPQFEAKKQMVGLGGVISNPDHITEILENVEKKFQEMNFEIIQSKASNIKGTKGNQEYFFYLKLKPAIACSNRAPTFASQFKLLGLLISTTSAPIIFFE